MKKLILISTILISGLVINAQTAAPVKAAPAKQKEQAPNPETKAKKQTAEIDKIATLNQEQKTKVYEINLAKDKLVDAARTKAGNDKTAFEAERKEINASRRKEISAVLTPEQIELLKKSKKAE